MDNHSAFVPDVHFEKIPIKNLVSNQTYQRNLSIAHIQKTAEHFDVHQINPVKVSRRDGINYVFNGQHTIEIVASVSGSRIRRFGAWRMMVWITPRKQIPSPSSRNM